jgi:hypothetical protein
VALVLGVFGLGLMASPGMADQPPGQLGYEGQPGNRAVGSLHGSAQGGDQHFAGDTHEFPRATEEERGMRK